MQKDLYDFRPLPTQKGSYYRRIEDIQRALRKMNADEFPSVAKFLAYMFSCEKLAVAIIGINKECQSKEVFCYRPKYKLTLKKIISGANRLSLSVNEFDLRYIFSNEDEEVTLSGFDNCHARSARSLRNKLVHDFGPTNVIFIKKEEDFLIERMETFLSCSREVLGYLRREYGYLV